MSNRPGQSDFHLFLALSGAERGLLFEAWWRLLAAAARLRLAPRRTLTRALAELPPRPPQASRESAGTLHPPFRSVAEAVGRAAAHHLVPMTCLPRALALRRMLAARGVAAVLRIGVRGEAGAAVGITAHAWVEVDGKPIGEPEAIAERFLPFVAPGRD